MPVRSLGAANLGRSENAPPVSWTTPSRTRTPPKMDLCSTGADGEHPRVLLAEALLEQAPGIIPRLWSEMSVCSDERAAQVAGKMDCRGVRPSGQLRLAHLKDGQPPQVSCPRFPCDRVTRAKANQRRPNWGKDGDLTF